MPFFVNFWCIFTYFFVVQVTTSEPPKHGIPVMAGQEKVLGYSEDRPVVVLPQGQLGGTLSQSVINALSQAGQLIISPSGGVQQQILLGQAPQVERVVLQQPIESQPFKIKPTIQHVPVHASPQMQGKNKKLSLYTLTKTSTVYGYKITFIILLINELKYSEYCYLLF